MSGRSPNVDSMLEIQTLVLSAKLRFTEMGSLFILCIAAAKFDPPKCMDLPDPMFFSNSGLERIFF